MASTLRELDQMIRRDLSDPVPHLYPPINKKVNAATHCNRQPVHSTIKYDSVAIPSSSPGLTKARGHRSLKKH